ncbi:hypothetical protein ACFTQ7_22220 [Lysinibacillus sp. NPDC056959]
MRRVGASGIALTANERTSGVGAGLLGLSTLVISIFVPSQSRNWT